MAFDEATREKEEAVIADRDEAAPGKADARVATRAG
jgi:hypothetical protein